MTTIDATRTTAATGATQGSSGTVLNSDFETFLKMLTVQMQNQDPLNPMDSSEYAMQLASFSSLEQQVLTNELLNSLVAGNNQSGLTALADWIGLEGRAAGPAQFDGTTGIEVAVSRLSYADAAQLVVLDSTGAEVDRVALPAGSDAMVWDGTGAAGDRLDRGLYSFRVENFVNGKLTQTTAGETWGKILEARSESGAVVLVRAGGAELTSDQISGVRLPAA
ncbi:flagellar hook capping FlgD N-terminal domain-containing protein [Thalassovita sp.]|uniref:flagellar hook capping FlgD N-terminal domain-containing protein n=1 Tax=Thalassovita sp. TaxID=1979401 RepID=UPI0029DE5E45|nr:flagellar hook capping FlgD N-terminal domain-containing protein [Thalassovita sp.]